MKRDELVQYLDDYLHMHDVEDYGPNGLQVEGKAEVQRVVGLVDCHQPSVDAAVAHNADMMIVHHGIFWGPARRLTGSYGRLVRTMMAANLNLYAAHLALDAHQELGNNAELARRLDLHVIDWWANIKGTNLAALAEAPAGATLDDLVQKLERRVGPVNLVQAHGPQQVRRVGVLSGAAPNFIATAAEIGCDTFITGETDHAHYYDALNGGINVIFAGHYASETVGIQALGQHLVEKLGLTFEFVDLPTGL